MARLVFLAVFLAAVFLAAAVDAQRWPPNGTLRPGMCLNSQVVSGNLVENYVNTVFFQTDIIEPAGADRVSVRFLAENWCHTAIRIMGGLRRARRTLTFPRPGLARPGGLRAPGRTIQQRGPIEIYALKVDKVDEDIACRNNPSIPSCKKEVEVIGKGSLESFVVPARETVAVDGLVMLDAGAVPADVTVVAASRNWPYGVSSTYGSAPRPRGSTGYCVHYADMRCGRPEAYHGRPRPH